jgi:hypothetical protein
MREAVQAGAFAVMVVLAAAGLWALGGALEDPAVPPPEQGLDLQLRIEGLGWVMEYNASDTANNTAFSLLLEASHALEFDVAYSRWEVPSGIKVDAILGLEDGDHGGRWWQYWVNGEYGDVSADKRALMDGDLLVWRYTTYPPPEAEP